jgi:flagellar hook-associated protein 2
MATITSLGIGSGLDINSMVEQLVALERRPLSQMRSDASRLQTQVSSYGKMQGLFSALQDASNALTSGTLWAKTTATSSDETVATVKAGTGAAAGSVEVQVATLARSQTASSQDLFADSSALVGAGTLTLAVGAWDAGATNFTPKAGSTAVDITVTATDTLATLRDKINAAGAGVSASIVTDASGSRLALRSSASGAENGFRVGVADDDGDNGNAAGLSRLAFDPPNGGRMQLAQAGVNATATVNGIAITSASNELTGAVPGLTITLKKEGASTELSMAADREAISNAVKTFAEAYSALAKYIAEQTKFDATSKTGGPLQGDSSATGLLARLRGVLNLPSGAAAAFPRLSDIGLEQQRDGTLKVDETKLASAMGDLAELKKAFSNTDTGTPANDGFARRYAQLAQQVLGVDGSLTTRQDGLQKLISRNGDDQARLEDRVERFRTRLVAQYTAMDANLSRLNALSSYVNQTLSALQKSNGGGSSN